MYNIQRGNKLRHAKLSHLYMLLYRFMHVRRWQSIIPHLRSASFFTNLINGAKEWVIIIIIIVQRGATTNRKVVILPTTTTLESAVNAVQTVSTTTSSFDLVLVLDHLVSASLLVVSTSSRAKACMRWGRRHTAVWRMTIILYLPHRSLLWSG